MTLQQIDKLGEVNEERMEQNLEVFGSWEEYQAFVADPEGGGKKPVDQVPPVVETPPLTGEEPIPDGSLVDAKPPTVPVTDEGGNGEVAVLKREVQALKSERGRWDKLTGESKDLKERLAAIETENERLKAEFEQRASASDDETLLKTILSDEERGLADADTLKFATRLAKAISKKNTDGLRKDLEDMKATKTQESASILQDRVTSMWSEHVDPVIPRQVWSKFQENPKWAEWCAKSYAGQKNGALFNGACSSLDSESTVDLLQRFMNFADIEIPTGSRPPRRPNTSSREAALPTNKDGKKTFYADDVERIESLANRGRSVGMTPNQFEKWGDEVDDARQNGRVIDRATNQPVF